MSENKAVKVRRWTLSEGKNVKSKTLTRKTIGEDDFWTEFKLVEDTTGYHFKEYRELSSSGIKSDIAKAKKQKDGPIFIAGEFADNRRLDKNLYSRSMLTLDLDHPKDSSLKQLLDRIEKSLSVLGDVNIIVYPSYSFTTPKPRLRVIVPLASDITFDTEQGKPLYQSVARYVIEAIGSEHFDIATSVSAIARPTYKPRVPRGFFDKKLNPYGSLEEWPVIFGKESAFLDAYALLESGDISITETDKKSRSKKSAEIIDFKAAQDERPEWTKAPDPEYTGPYNDDKLIEIAMKPQRNSGFAGATFKSLYNNDGAQLRKFYKSDKMECDHNYSDADMALCHRLLYYTGNDCERTLHLLMQSQRVTDKWLTRIDDYVKRTISNALAQRRKNNSPIYKYIGEDADVDIPEIAEYCEFSDIDFVPLPLFTVSDYNNARIISERVFDGRVKSDGSEFYFWNGKCHELIDHTLLKKAISKILSGSQGKDGIIVTMAKVDSNTNALNLECYSGNSSFQAEKVFFNNGAYNLKTNELEPHNKTNNNAFNIAYDYVDSPEAPVEFLRWIDEIFEGDTGRINLLQEIMGWSLIKGNFNIQKAVLLKGPTRAGKGLVLEILSHILKKGKTEFNLEGLLSNKILCSMKDKNIAINFDVVDASKNAKAPIVGRFKEISANEPVPIEMLYVQRATSVRLNCKLFLAANNIPALYDDSGAAAGRWVVLVFDKCYEGKEDTELKDRLIKEADRIVMWMLEGLKRLKARGKFDLPESSIAAINDIRSDSSGLHDFIEDCLEFDKSYSCLGGEPWVSYESWSNKNSDPVRMGSRTFKKALLSATSRYGVRTSNKVIGPDGKEKRGYLGMRVKSK